jgi:hypothetical protein
MNAGKLLVVVAVMALAVSTFAAAPVSGAKPVAPAAAENEMFGGIGYTFWSDYGWRGLNMTKAIGGHRGKGANQMIYNLGMNVQDLGKVGVSLEQVYFNSFDCTDASLAFTNWNVYITREIDGISGKWTLGYGNHVWENLRNAYSNGDARSQEFYLTYAWGDACLWQTITGQETGNVLNPSLTYLVDTDNADGGSVAILALNHPFNLADVDPELTGLTLIPTFSVTYDHRYYSSYINSLTGTKDLHDTNKIAYMDYGLKAIADLTSTVGLTSGKLSLTGGVGYTDGVELSDGKWYGNTGLAYNF